jgi:hypothetical protein
MLRVRPEALTESVGTLRDVAEVSRAVDGGRGELTAQLARAGSEPVRRSVESFLDAWSSGLRGVAERADRLGGTLHTASTAYQEAERRLRGQVAGGADGGPA